MCKRIEETFVRVRIPADLSCDGREKWKDVKIDSCIAPLVKALQNGAIDMRGSCCGHNEKHGWIELQDKRLLLVIGGQGADRYWHSPARFYIHSLWRYIRYAVKNHMNRVWRE